MSTPSFQEALLRAKQLAAKMGKPEPSAGGDGFNGNGNGVPVPPPPPPPSNKRERSDDEDEWNGPEQKRPFNEYGGGGGDEGNVAPGGPFSGGDRMDRGDPDRPQRNRLYLDGIVYQGEKTLDLLIPGNKVGIIIGKSGATIKSLQQDTNVKMMFIQETTEVSSREKQLRLIGPPECVDHAQKVVDDMLSDRNRDRNGNGRGGPGGGPGGFQNQGHPGGGMHNQMPGGPNFFEYPISTKFVGLVIGKQGETIRKIQAESGCRVQFDPQKSDPQGNRICQLNGSQDSISRALDMIKRICDSLGAPDGMDEVRLLVPANKAGSVIGRGGETIKNLKMTSGCNIELEKGYLNEHDEKCFIIRGSADKIQLAHQLVDDKVGGNARLLSTTVKNNPYQDTVLAHHLMKTGAHGYIPPGESASQQAPEDLNAYYSAAYYQQYYAQAGIDPASGMQMASASSAAAAAAAGAPAQAGGQDQEAIVKQWVDYYNAYGMKAEAEAMEKQLRELQRQKGGMDLHR